MNSAYESLMGVSEGDTVTVRIEDFDNTRYPKEENPRTIRGVVENVNPDVSYAAGEIQRVVTIGNPWEGGCSIDVADTAENKLVDGGYQPRKYLKAWRPRCGKNRLLLGKVSTVEVDE